MFARILLFMVMPILVKPLLQAQTDSINSSTSILKEVLPPPPPYESEEERIKRAVFLIQDSLPDVPLPKFSTNDSEPDPTSFVPGAKQPKERNLSEVQKLIGYPEAAFNMNLEGNIVFRVLVDEEGNYAKHLPAKSGHPIFIKAAEEHINKLKFTPAIQGDKPIKFWVNVPFVFRLPKPDSKKE